MIEYSKNIVKVLRCLRVFHGMTQAELAEKIGMSKSYISEIEAGAKRVNVEILEKYATEFDFPLSHIMIYSEIAADNSLAEKARTYLSCKAVAFFEFIAAQNN